MSDQKANDSLPVGAKEIAELVEYVKARHGQRDAEIALALTRLVRERDNAVAALRHIRWIKDGGIDGMNERGEWVNFSADERDAMYRIATAALSPAAQQKERKA